MSAYINESLHGCNPLLPHFLTVTLWAGRGVEHVRREEGEIHVHVHAYMSQPLSYTEIHVHVNLVIKVRQCKATTCRPEDSYFPWKK